MSSRLWISLLLSTLISVGPWVTRPAFADRKEDARAAADRGDRAFSKGAWDQALVEYQASFDKYPKPFLLFKLAECHRNLAHDQPALDAYKKYLAKVSKGADRRKAEAYAAELEKKIAAATPVEKAPEPVPEPVVQSTDVEAPPLDTKQIEAQDRERKKHKGKKGKHDGPPEETTATAPKDDKLPPGWDPSSPPPDPTPAFEEPEPPKGPVPLYKKWWLWTAVGGVVAVGVGLTVGLVLGLPKFESELPIGGPGASALTVKSLTVRF